MLVEGSLKMTWKLDQKPTVTKEKLPLAARSAGTFPGPDLKGHMKGDTPAVCTSL